MKIGRVIGTVIATQKDPALEGFKLLVVRELNLQGEDTNSFVVAVDVVQAGVGEKVLLTSGSSARQTAQTKNKPVDAVVVGIVDEIKLEKEWFNR